MRNCSLSAALVVLAVALVGCASGSDVGLGSSSCTPGTMSTPGADDDPCDQSNISCPSTTHMAVTTCGMDNTWVAKPGGMNCECKPRGSTPPMPGIPCGNGKVDSGEQCDTKAALPATATCAAMRMGTGMVTCNATCKFDTSMCTAGTGGSGGTGSGGASGM